MATPCRGASGKSGGGSRWRQVDFDTGVGPVPSGVSTAPSESRPPGQGGGGCLGVWGCIGCPRGPGPRAKAAQSPASKHCWWLGPGVRQSPRSQLRSPVLLPASPGVQLPSSSCALPHPPSTLGASSRAGDSGQEQRWGRSFPSPTRTWESQGGLVGAVSRCGWGTSLGTSACPGGGQTVLEGSGRGDNVVDAGGFPRFRDEAPTPLGCGCDPLAPGL